jgi:hypothetical protein
LWMSWNLQMCTRRLKCHYIRQSSELYYVMAARCGPWHRSGNGSSCIQMENTEENLRTCMYKRVLETPL